MTDELAAAIADLCITDATVVVRNDESKSVIYACSALTGAPIANARVKLWERHGDSGRDVAKSFDATTNATKSHDNPRTVNRR